MAGYLVFWSREYLKKLEKAGDRGPLSVVFGGRHSKMPALAGVRPGDVLYPAALLQGTLCVMARLPVDAVENAFWYLMRETGRHRGALIPGGVALETARMDGSRCFLAAGGRLFDSAADLPADIQTVLPLSQQADLPHRFHQEPQTCCAETAAVGARGSAILPRPLPPDCLGALRFGPTPRTRKPLRLDARGVPSVTSLSGFVRRMSEETQERFEAAFAEDAAQ